MTYDQGMGLRPFSMGCQPMDGLIDVKPEPLDFTEDLRCRGYKMQNFNLNSNSNKQKSVTAKEYLLQLQILDTKINQKIEESAQLRDIVQGRGMSCDSERVQTSPTDVQANTIIKYLDIEREIDRMIDDYVDQKDKIINQIHGLSDVRYIKILFDRYVPDENGHTKSFEQISVDMNYSYTYVCDLHGQALIAFAEVIRKNPKQSVIGMWYYD